jgi:hypothetical protein
MKVIPVAIPPAATFSASLAAIGHRGCQTATTVNRLLAVGQIPRSDRPILLHRRRETTPQAGHAAAVSATVTTCTVRAPSLTRSTRSTATSGRPNRIVVPSSIARGLHGCPRTQAVSRGHQPHARTTTACRSRVARWRIPGQTPFANDPRRRAGGPFGAPRGCQRRTAEGPRSHRSRPDWQVEARLVRGVCGSGAPRLPLARLGPESWKCRAKDVSRLGGVAEDH